jgi:hypothetical protein
VRAVSSNEESINESGIIAAAGPIKKPVDIFAVASILHSLF